MPESRTALAAQRLVAEFITTWLDQDYIEPEDLLEYYGLIEKVPATEEDYEVLDEFDLKPGDMIYKLTDLGYDILEKFKEENSA